MCMFDGMIRCLTLLALSGLFACAQSGLQGREYPERYNFGTVLASGGKDVPLAEFPPDGEGLPEGSGTFEQGKKVYVQKCASCHGENLEGTAVGLPLIGGRESLAGATPLRTVESYWPYAPPVYSYIRNAMPTTAPGSLGDDETYALMAYILGSADIVPRDMIMTGESLPEVKMPNRDGFVPDPRPDVVPGTPGK